MKKSYAVARSCKSALALFTAVLCSVAAAPLRADTVTITGQITQSVQDGTGPAVNNPGLNAVVTGETYTIEFSFLGSISSPGTHSLTDLIFSFSTAGNGLTENQIDTGSVTVIQNGDFDILSVLACLQSGSGCEYGNQVELNFVIPSSDLNAQKVTALQVAGVLPLDVLEDDGATDIHGTVSSYSYSPSRSVPEPLGIETRAFGTMALALSRIRRLTKQ